MKFNFFSLAEICNNAWLKFKVFLGQKSIENQMLERTLECFPQANMFRNVFKDTICFNSFPLITKEKQIVSTTGIKKRALICLQGKFYSAPTVLVSAGHETRGVKHDASSVWVEDLMTTSFKICVRELQNFDGAHQGIHVVSYAS